MPSKRKLVTRSDLKPAGVPISGKRHRGDEREKRRRERETIERSEGRGFVFVRRRLRQPVPGKARRNAGRRRAGPA